MADASLEELRKTKNLIDLYLHAQGETEMPDDLHRWSFISLLAACLRDRVWIDKPPKLFPNLYTLLITASGIGKGGSIGPIHKLADIKGLEPVNARRIKVTAPSLIDLLAKNAPANAAYRANKIFLLMPELSNSVGGKETASGLIKCLTDFYDGTDFNIEEHTRTSGFHKLPHLCINWLAGSTKEWLISSLQAGDVLSGFTARTFCIIPEYNQDKRLTRPIRPDNYNEIMSYIKARLIGMTTLATRKGGEFKLTPEAEEEHDHWYQTRDGVPMDDMKFPSWKRAQDQILKLTMVFSLASEDHHWKMIGTPEDFHAAREAWESVYANLPELVSYATATQQSQSIDLCRNILKTHGYRMKRSALLQASRLRLDEFTWVISTLEQTREIETKSTNGGEEVYILRQHDFSKPLATVTKLVTDKDVTGRPLP